MTCKQPTCCRQVSGHAIPRTKKRVTPGTQQYEVAHPWMGLCAWKVSGGRCAGEGGGLQPGGLENSGGSCPNWMEVSCAMSTRFDLQHHR